MTCRLNLQKPKEKPSLRTTEINIKQCESDETRENKAASNLSVITKSVSR